MGDATRAAGPAANMALRPSRRARRGTYRVGLGDRSGAALLPFVCIVISPARILYLLAGQRVLPVPGARVNRTPPRWLCPC